MPSFSHFLIINSTLMTLGTGTFLLHQNAPAFLLPWFLFFDIGISTSIGKIHNPQNRIDVRQLLKILPVSFLNMVSYFLATHISNSNELSIFYDVMTFIPRSLVFELFFDFFHYCFHRLFHVIPFLYKHIHAIHHKHIQISVHTTYEHHLLDLLFTNMVPILLSCALIRPSTWFLSVWFVYKVTEEIGGHAGVPIKASCFPQCIWLPRWLNIELYSMDHAYHHKNTGKNFSKRFRFWDQLFGTYKSGRNNSQRE